MKLSDVKEDGFYWLKEDNFNEIVPIRVKDTNSEFKTTFEVLGNDDTQLDESDFSGEILCKIEPPKI